MSGRASGVLLHGMELETCPFGELRHGAAAFNASRRFVSGSGAGAAGAGAASHAAARPAWRTATGSRAGTYDGA